MLVLRALAATYALASSSALGQGIPNQFTGQPKPAEGPGDLKAEPFTPDNIEFAVAGNVSAKVVLHGWEGCEVRAPCNVDNTKQQLVNASAIEFWGSKRKADRYRALVQENMNSLATQQSASWWDWKLHVRCDDPARECSSNTETYTVNGGEYISVIASITYEYDVLSKIPSNFCDFYFRYTSLESTVDRVAGESNELTRDYLARYKTRATVWAHELMHVARVGKTDPQLFLPTMPDFEYGRDGTKWKQYLVVDAKWLALGDSSPDNAASHNPQNYTYFALANYINSKKGFYPSGPVWTSIMEPPLPGNNAGGSSDGGEVPEDTSEPLSITEC
ncbi:hypothetical protein IQ06DRAFT_363826 [Phaeosphaeriaceae sp. SRC1lsM3a]|nr:hypothetical protein IQ06DRAFT_363826 [Stagonospora sp. SRC1lsM3a]